MEGFAKYIGVQGLLTLALGVGYIAAPYADVALPQGYTELMSLVVGFYFARNGPNVISAVRRSP